MFIMLLFFSPTGKPHHTTNTVLFLFFTCLRLSSVPDRTEQMCSSFILSFISSYPFSSTRKNTSSQRASGEPSSRSHLTSNPQEAQTEKLHNFLNFCSQQLNLIYSKNGFIILIVYSTLPITYFSSFLPDTFPASNFLSHSVSISFLVHEPAALLFSQCFCLTPSNLSSFRLFLQCNIRRVESRT